MKALPYAALAFLSIGVTGYAVFAYGFLPLGSVVHPDMRLNFEAHRLAIYTHVFASAVALFLGPLQFSSGLRSARPFLHRLTGRVYLGLGVLLGGTSGLFMASHAFGGHWARLGFTGLAIAWLCTGLLAYLAIRRRDVTAHRRWMVRNFALTFAAVTLRLWLPASALAGVDFEAAYPVIAWLCWVPNLLFAEFIVNRKSNAIGTRPRTVRDA